IEAGQYPGFAKTTLDGVNQIDYLTGKSNKSARDVFYYFSGATPSAVRYKNWKMYYTMSQPGAEGWIMPLVPFHFTLVQNIRRDPWERAVGIDKKSGMSMGGALAPPSPPFFSGAAKGIPADAGPRELQPHAGDGANQGREWARR